MKKYVNCVMCAVLLFVSCCVVLSYIRFKGGKGIIFNCEFFVTSALSKLALCFVVLCFVVLLALYIRFRKQKGIIFIIKQM